MLVTFVSVLNLLERKFRTMADGGYAGVVLIVGRSADAPAVFERLIADWSSTHDLTAEVFAVIMPQLDSSILISRARGGYGWAARDVVLLGNGERLARLNTSVPGLVVARSVPTSSDAHLALNQVATSLRTFFGLSEDLLPCAVVLPTDSNEALVIPLSADLPLYDFLKQTTLKMEGAVHAVREARADVEAAHAALQEARTRARAVLVHQQWAEQRAVLAQDLKAAAGVRGSIADELLWMSIRVSDLTPLDETEQNRADDLVVALRPMKGGALGRRIRRCCHKINTRYPAGNPEVPSAYENPRAAEGAPELGQVQARLEEAKARATRLAAEIELSSTVVAVGRSLGLRENQYVGLLPTRAFRGSVTTLTRPTAEPVRIGHVLV